MKTKHKNRFLNSYKWWDYSYLLQAMEDWLENSSKQHSKHGHLVGSDKTAKQMKVAAALIKRIREDEYHNNLNKVFPCRNKTVMDKFCLGKHALEWNPKEDLLRKQDLQYLMKFMEKHILGWWD